MGSSKAGGDSFAYRGSRLNPGQVASSGFSLNLLRGGQSAAASYFALALALDCDKTAVTVSAQAFMVPLKKLSVLIVHHAPLTRFGLTTLIKMSRHFRVVGDTGEGPVARQMFAQTSPDLVVLSLTLQHGDGIDLLKDFKRLNPLARALVLTARTDSLSLQRAFKAGARGYVVAEEEIAEVLHALERVAAGELYASGTVARGLLQMLANGSVETRRDGCGHLSDRELQVFRLIGSGLGTSRIATELQLSVKTIETHRQRIKQKLGLTTGAELTQRAVAFQLQAARERIRSAPPRKSLARPR